MDSITSLRLCLHTIVDYRAIRFDQEFANWESFVKSIRQFNIQGLFGTKNVSLEIGEDCLILVGPNGVGKSTVINIFYFFISRQWSRLLEYKFEAISIEFDDTEIIAHRNDITGLFEVGRIFSDKGPRTRNRLIYERLADTGVLEEFVGHTRVTAGDRSRYAELIGVSSSEITMFHRSLQRRMTANEDDLFRAPRLNLEKTIAEAFPSRTLYLPTYRRIEKELGEIFPEMNRRYLEYTGHELTSDTKRSSDHYVDLVSFGMEDVKINLARTGRSLKDYSLGKYNDLSALYLRDVIREKASEYTVAEISSLNEEDIVDILSRVSETALSGQDKRLLMLKIQEIQHQDRSSVSENEKYLAHYFSRLVKVTDEIRLKEKNISSFVNVCNTYLNPQKYMIYDEFEYKVTVYDSDQHEIDLSLLSSGEKQIVSVFSHLFLDESLEQIVVIDEPELSLSVPWQKMLLADILNSEKCAFVLAVTHSPFIYENSLREYAKDIRQFIRN